jgi:hypothetical protein
VGKAQKPKTKVGRKTGHFSDPFSEGLKKRPKNGLFFQLWKAVFFADEPTFQVSTGQNIQLKPTSSVPVHGQLLVNSESKLTHFTP